MIKEEAFECLIVIDKMKNIQYLDIENAFLKFKDGTIYKFNENLEDGCYSLFALDILKTPFLRFSMKHNNNKIEYDYLSFNCNIKIKNY